MTIATSARTIHRIFPRCLRAGSAAWVALAVCLLPVLAWSQAPGSGDRSAAAETGQADELALSQSELADKYARLEKLLLRMAEFDQADNPHRAELLKKAFSLGKSRGIQSQYEALVTLLRDEQFGDAIGRQKSLRGDLDNLLRLLSTEDRADRAKNERARVREYIREIERLERMQRSVQGRTEGGADESEVTREQHDTAERTRALEKRIEASESPPPDDASKAAEGDPGSGDTQEAKDPPASPGSPEESTPNSSAEEGLPSESTESPPAAAPSGDSQGAPNQPSPAEGAPSPPSPAVEGAAPAEPSPSKPSDEFPGSENLRKAEQAMRDAEQKLKDAEREGALEDQRRAARELAEAKARLEEILRQLREEEIERMLTLLEARVKKMLEMQVQVHDDTVRLDKALAKSTDRGLEIEAGKLGFEQRRIVAEADKALALLKEEGSSVAFPETLEQARRDMDQVAVRLSRVLLGSVTQGIEEDVIAALEEMLDALKQAQMDQRDRQSQGQQGEPSEPGDEPLVDQIAELKMIKSLQLRINRRTQRYANLLEHPDDMVGQATDRELMEAIQDLAGREARLHEITRDLVLGKNR